MKGGGFQDWNNPQLARKGFHHFENAIHETCVIENGSNSIGQLKEMMWHLNDDSYKERMQKSMLYSQFQSARLIEKRLKIEW